MSKNNSQNYYIKSEVESDRFKMNILRVKSDNINIKEIQKHIFQYNTDILFLRIPSTATSEIQSLTKLGFEYFQADTLVYYQVDFNSYLPNAIKNNDLEFVKATNDDSQLLSIMVDKIFEGYSNHYFSNSFINKINIIEGYTEWVLSFINNTEKEVFIVKKNNEAIAFASCSYKDSLAEGVLYGVMPNYTGGGIYSDLIRFTQNYYFNKGIRKMIVSTQIQNYAVQKVWNREGFCIDESFSTIHINSMLNFSIYPEKKVFFKVTESQIKQYGDLSKDYNSIHFEDEIAIKNGFKNKIAHGLIASGEISRILGMEFPGEGSIFMNYKNIFIAPFYPNNVYKFVLTTPFCNEKGFYLCLVKVYDNENKLIMLSYNQLKKVK